MLMLLQVISRQSVNRLQLRFVREMPELTGDQIKVDVCSVPQVELMKQLVVGLDLADLNTHLNVAARTCSAEGCCGT